VDRRPNRLIIPQYTAPKELSLVAAAELLGAGRQAMAAQVVEFAVKRVITIARPETATRRSGFTLRVAKEILGGSADEHDVLAAIFNSDPPQIGETVWVRPRQNRSLGERLRDPHRKIVARLIVRGLAREKNLWTKLLRPWRKQPVVPTAAAEPIIDYLWGIHDYIKLAERERFAVLQSPEGAQRSALDVLLLNEKLLPFAVLFGLEKQWAAQLDIRVQAVQRDLSRLDGSFELGNLDFDVFNSSSDLLSLLQSMPDLGDLVDLGSVLEGVGAIFGGIVEGILSGLSA
jgi:hypothetical protein